MVGYDLSPQAWVSVCVGSALLREGGFLDQFTVTFHRGAAMLAVESWDAFDARFGTKAAR